MFRFVTPLLLVLIVACSKPIDENALIDKDGMKYQQDTQKPYTGEMYELYNNGIKKVEGTYKDGRKIGLWKEWYNTEEKMYELNYKDGGKDGLYTKWHEWSEEYRRVVQGWSAKRIMDSVV